MRSAIVRTPPVCLRAYSTIIFQIPDSSTVKCGEVKSSGILLLSLANPGTGQILSTGADQRQSADRDTSSSDVSEVRSCVVFQSQTC
ncbi:hypothetical protein MPTK1_3g19250 [Marchantia polymorpha subsp. ruderalis]|uniref:Uncharacterized protein n=2 Tax=Marchantia polymorpha TaxID=3197 RepID=A0AAF6B2H5_MARPO|nr:hypothetical protein MARPO_0049s0109 [Marchantia polymorpha]PTQ38834.1 hypothetical protein MARPO_0049s0109 [Marchantia polymorpha]BBN06209.1 hypothetical protein Mp_3g19250 [Marchantia polymorpha subsp. ruderalis]BBN06210.1 hypothetical protein Mp_3g19250 [Marchantia polymorpha subsp. ruderalis]|eukprot:PTQ38833.1 hypothetical protein MARPO_0049s0109 [Marchantia polymorpha]